jgi:pimeloyl-ACP methyl ester carboxylesterase
MIFTRALADYATNSDLVTLARLAYIDRGLDPQTLEVIPDPSWSDAIFYGVECQDYGYPGATPAEKAENYLRGADPFEASIPRLASIIYGDMPCAYWPNATSDLTRPDYLVAEGIPTLVLGATADPATPVSHGIQVYQHLADGYLITTEGGPHVTFGYGIACPDELVTSFLVDDTVPAQRETVCEGQVADPYVPVAPRNAKAFSDPAAAL